MKLGKVKKDENGVLAQEYNFLHYGSAKRECPEDFKPYLSAHAACDVSVRVDCDLSTREPTA